MEIDACFKIGFVLRTHGLKGEVTLSLDDDVPDNLESLQSVFLEKDKRLIPFFIHTIAVQGKKALVKFDDITSIDEASRLVKHAVYLEKSKRPKSVRGEFYNDEIVGFEVTDEAVGLLGPVAEVMQAGPNRLLAVDYQGKEVLIPVNSPFILSINKRNKAVTVRLPEGFLDI